MYREGERFTASEKQIIREELQKRNLYAEVFYTSTKPTLQQMIIDYNNQFTWILAAGNSDEIDALQKTIDFKSTNLVPYTGASATQLNGSPNFYWAEGEARYGTVELNNDSQFADIEIIAGTFDKTLSNKIVASTSPDKSVFLYEADLIRLNNNRNGIFPFTVINNKILPEVKDDKLVFTNEIADVDIADEDNAPRIFALDKLLSSPEFRNRATYYRRCECGAPYAEFYDKDLNKLNVSATLSSLYIARYQNVLGLREIPKESELFRYGVGYALNTVKRYSL